MKLNIKKGDTVVVLSGKNKGKKGKVLQILVQDEKVIIEAINMVKKHQKPSRNFQGGIVEKPAPMAYSKVKLICPRCNKPTRVSRSDSKRKCKKCEEIIDKD